MTARTISRAATAAKGVLVVTLLVTAAACDPPQSTEPPSEPGPTVSAGATEPGGGTFRYGIGEPTAIVAPLAATIDDQAVVDALYDSLTTWDPAGRPLPSAAASWISSDDLTQWVFTLRPGATFHDGTPVSAEDFRRSWDTVITSGVMGHLLSDVAGYSSMVQGVTPSLPGLRVEGADTLHVSLSRPRADLPVLVGHPALGPLHPADDGPEPILQPTGNGPFALTEPWAPDAFIRAARWEGWRNGERTELGIAEVVFRSADVDINFLAFVQGRRDFTAVPDDAVALADEDYPGQAGTWDGPGLITGGTPEMYVLAMNPEVPPYDQLAVREAVSLIADRVRLAMENEGGNLAPATSLLPPALPGVRVGTCDLCTYNPSGAADRMQAAGVSQLSLWFNAGGGHDRVRDVLRDALSDIGVGLVSNGRGAPPDLAAYQQLLAAGDVGLFRLPMVADVPSSLSVLLPLLHGDQTPEAGGLNYMRYDDPQVTALLDQAARTVDVLTREVLLRRVEDIAVNRDSVVVPLFSYQHAVVASEAVSGLRYGPFGLLNLTEVVLDR